MSRVVKQVPLEFDHPIGTAWPGPLPPPVGDGWQMWETTALEDLPVSPVFDTLQDFSSWLVTTNPSALRVITATDEKWLSTINAKPTTPRRRRKISVASDTYALLAEHAAEQNVKLLDLIRAVLADGPKATALPTARDRKAIDLSLPVEAQHAPAVITATLDAWAETRGLTRAEPERRIARNRRPHGAVRMKSPLTLPADVVAALGGDTTPTAIVSALTEWAGARK